jgi:hypothetical protein
MFTTSDLVRHFGDLLEDLKNGELSSEKVRDLSLLYVKHQKEEYDKKEPEDTDTEENLKYFALGWYIHNFLIKKPIK